MGLPTNLPLSTHLTLKDGTYGVVCKLHTGSFSQADLTAMNASPELIISWYFGTGTLPSGIVKGADDKVYYPSTTGGIYLELTYGETKIDAEGVYSTMTGTGNTRTHTVVNGVATFTLHVETDTSKESQVGYKLDTLIPFRIRNTIETTSGISDFAYIGRKASLSASVKGDRSYAGKFDVGTVNVGDVISWGQGGGFVYSGFNVVAPYDCIFRQELFSITSEYLEIHGTYTQSNTSRYGVQGLELKENSAGVPTGLAKANTIEGGSDGRYVRLPLVDNTKQKHLITKCLKEIKGDITAVVDTECTP